MVPSKQSTSSSDSSECCSRHTTASRNPADRREATKLRGDTDVCVENTRLSTMTTVHSCNPSERCKLAGSETTVHSHPLRCKVEELMCDPEDELDDVFDVTPMLSSTTNAFFSTSRPWEKDLRIWAWSSTARTILVLVPPNGPTLYNTIQTSALKHIKTSKQVQTTQSSTL